MSWSDRCAETSCAARSSCPRAAWACSVEPDVADALIADVDGEPGGLPLLSAALVELWQHRDGRALRLVGYERAGGVHGAVARLAERAYERLDADQRARRAQDSHAPGGRRRGRRRGAPPGSARRARRGRRRARRRRHGARRPGRRPAGHRRERRCRGRTRGAAARMATPARLARGGRAGPPPAPAPDPRVARLADRGPRAGRAVPGGAARLRAGLDGDPRAGAQRARARVPGREPVAGRRRERAPAEGEPPPSRAAGGTGGASGARAGRRRGRGLPARSSAGRRPDRRRAAPRRRGAHARAARGCAGAGARRRGARRLGGDAQQPALGADAPAAGARHAARGRCTPCSPQP